MKQILNKVEVPLPELDYTTLHEKRPNTEFFLVRIRKNTDQKKLCIKTLFKQC